jgi:hypothetical protein
VSSASLWDRGDAPSASQSSALHFAAHESEDFIRAIRGSEKVSKNFSQKSIDTLWCVQLKGALPPALAGSAGELTTGKNKKSGK